MVPMVICTSGCAFAIVSTPCSDPIVEIMWILGTPHYKSIYGISE